MKLWKKLWIFALLLLPFCLHAQQWKTALNQQFFAEIHVSKNSIQLIDDLEISLRLDFPNDYQIDKDALINNLRQSFGPLSSPFLFTLTAWEIKNNTQNTTHIDARFKASPQYAGKLFLSFFEIIFSNKEKIVKLATEIFYINVTEGRKILEKDLLPAPLLSLSTSYPVNMTIQNRLSQHSQGNHENVKNKFKEKQPPFFFLILVIAISVAFIIKKSGKLEKKVEIKKNKKNAKEQAIASLNLLKNRIEHTSDKEFYSSLVATLKIFIHQSYAFRSTSKTTEEFLKEMHSLNIEEEELKKIATTLRLSDKVKFSKASISLADRQKSSSVIRNFIIKALI